MSTDAAAPSPSAPSPSAPSPSAPSPGESGTPRLAVGFLATPSGTDGVALAVALAEVLGAAIDLVCVVRPASDDTNHPGLAGYQARIEAQARQWLADGAGVVPDAIETTTRVVVHDSFAEGLIGVATETGAEMIVVGGAGDGVLSRHTLGTVSTELLHSAPLPVALAPRGYAERDRFSVDTLTVAVPVRAGGANPLAVAVALADRAELDLRLLSLVSLDDADDTETARTARAHQVSVAQELLERTRASVGVDHDVDALVADGATLDEALDNLRWDDGDVVVVGSGHLGAPARVFLGSTAARILRWTTAPLIVVPRP